MMACNPDSPQPLDLDEIREDLVRAENLLDFIGHENPDGVMFSLGTLAEHTRNLLTEVERLHTWQGIMSLVDEHYPVTIFPIADDDPGRDDGPRILSLIRHLNAIENRP